MNLPYIIVEGIVEGVQTVGRKYFSCFFGIKKELTKLFKASILFIVNTLRIWNTKENNEHYQMPQSRKYLLN